MRIKNWILCITVAVTLLGGSTLSTMTQKVATKNPVMTFIEHGVGGGEHQASS
ncbi:hypothetical protein ABNF65_21330 [Paenibacillus larvae]